MTSLCIAYVTLLWLKLSIACIISYGIRVKHNKQIHMFSDFLHCEVYTCGWCYYLWFSKNSHACEEFGDCVAQKNCSTKQIAVQSHGSCFIYLGCQLTHKDCWFIEYNQGIKTNSWSVNWEVYEKSGYLLRIQYGYGQSMVNRHKSSLSGHVNLFFLAIIVANYTYTNGPLSMHLNVHSMVHPFSMSVSSATDAPCAVFGFHRWKPTLFCASLPRRMVRRVARRDVGKKAPFVGVADLFWGCWDDMTLCFLVKDQLPLAQ